MNNPRCAVCGHINRAGAASCEMCDARPGGAAGAPGAGSSRPEGEGYGALPTDIPSPQFKGVGDVITPTLEIYRNHFLLVGLLVLVTAAPVAFLQYAGSNTVLTTGEFRGEGIGARAGGFGFVGAGRDTLLLWLLTTLGYALLSGALAHAVVQIQRTGAARAGESLRWGLRKMFKVFAVTLVTYLAVYGVPAVLVAGLAFAVGPAAFIGVLLMLLPWVVLMLTFSMAVPAAAIENRGVFGSLARSAELTRGYRGLIFLTYFLWWVAIAVLSLVVTRSFYYGGGGGSAASLLVQLLVGGMLNSSMFVLTVYVFLGILNENRQGFVARAFAPAGR
ncbi:MAG TPA: hypothetical protein VF659_10195 [Pyrinomonadaceae bacterium]|jgi:hypothetical protein